MQKYWKQSPGTSGHWLEKDSKRQSWKDKALGEKKKWKRGGDCDKGKKEARVNLASYMTKKINLGYTHFSLNKKSVLSLLIKETIFRNYI